MKEEENKPTTPKPSNNSSKKGKHLAMMLEVPRKLPNETADEFAGRALTALANQAGKMKREGKEGIATDSMPSANSEPKNDVSYFSSLDIDPYEDDGEGYGSRASRDSEDIVTTYGGWMDMLRVALVYGWQPEGGSYYCCGPSRIVSPPDAAELHRALERYIAAPHEAYDRWLAYVARPKEQQARIFPMGDEKYDYETKACRPVDPVTSGSAAHWRDLCTGGCHSEFARRLSDFFSRGEFRI